MWLLLICLGGAGAVEQLRDASPQCLREAGDSTARLLLQRQKARSLQGPCDIYGAAGTPCVAAHSVVRALYGSYAGPLYVVQRNSDKTTAQIFVLGPGGVADAARQDAFCQGADCVIQMIFDQSPQGNHISVAPAGGAKLEGGQADSGVNASKEEIWIGGHRVYGAYFEGQMGYRNNTATGLAEGDSPESMYMVTSGRHYNDKCCFDYGNAERSSIDEGEGTMEAIYWGNSSSPATGWGKGFGSGPWVKTDLENGLWAGKSKDVTETNIPIRADFVTAMMKGGSGRFALKGGDANKAGSLMTLFEGPRPAVEGYDPMKKQGAIILGIGGDNSNWGVGSFYEGVMTVGYALAATDEAVHANIVAAGYGRTSSNQVT